MNYLFNTIPIGLYSILVILVGFVFIYGIIDMKKKKTGHPFTNALYFLLVLGLYTIPYKMIQAYSQNSLLLNMSSYILWILVIATVVAFVYFAYMAYKCGYLDEKSKQLLRYTLLPCFIILVVCIIIICICLFMKSNA